MAQDLPPRDSSLRRLTTTRALGDGARSRLFRRTVALRVVQGADRGATISSSAASLTVGAAAQNDLVLCDPTVSRHHLRLEITPRGLLLTDLGSTNGSFLGRVRVHQILVDEPIELRLGDSTVQIGALDTEQEVPLADAEQFGAFLGRSAPMRELFARLETAAPKNVTVLIEGETGTGKELLAQEIHRHSPRAAGPFVVVDCGAIPPSLIESELFGHQRGAFTGAETRSGAFEEAHGGTIFLDEIGELELAMQPRLLRVLEQRQVKRLGEVQYRRVDVRVLAATNRDLQRAINDGSFRADLYYRLAVVTLRLPPLRERPDDIELLATRLLPEVASRLGLPCPASLTAATIQDLVRYPWPGNARELRNFLERLLTLSRGTVPALEPAREARSAAAPHEPSLDELTALPFREAKSAWIASFDHAYLGRLLERCNNNVAEAARQSEIDRAHLFRLLKKYGLKR